MLPTEVTGRDADIVRYVAVSPGLSLFAIVVREAAVPRAQLLTPSPRPEPTPTATPSPSPAPLPGPNPNTQGPSVAVALAGHGAFTHCSPNTTANRYASCGYSNPLGSTARNGPGPFDTDGLPYSNRTVADANINRVVNASADRNAAPWTDQYALNASGFPTDVHADSFSNTGRYAHPGTFTFTCTLTYSHAHAHAYAYAYSYR